MQHPLIIRCGPRFIGVGQPCFIAAEIGINHNGDMALARKAIDAAAAAGADAVKFQNYRTEDFVLDRDLSYSYISQGREITETQHDLFKRCELSDEQLSVLKAHCDQVGVGFFSTPTGIDGVATLRKLGADLIKNGSDCLTQLELVTEMAGSGLPVVLSTGMATLAEIDDAVSAFRLAGGKELILLHCTSSYPTPATEVNLRRIAVLGQTFGCPAGFSDHTEGITAAVGAVALGACFVEKHFTVDRDLPGPDHRFSSDPSEFKRLVQGIRVLEQSLGSPGVGPTPSEMLGRRDFRLSCTALRDLPAGHVVTRTDIGYSRPGNGVPPKLIEAIVGRSLRRAIKGGVGFQWIDFG